VTTPDQQIRNDHDRHCIEVDLGPNDLLSFTVDEYDTVQRQRYDQPLWARRVDPVQDLKDEGHRPYPTCITDRDAYNAQMRRLLGLDPPPEPSKAACNICGAPLEATVVQYLSDVGLDGDGRVNAYRIADCNDPDGYAWDHPTARVYCANDHEASGWEPPAHRRG
jgi:hypothetical protein